MRTIQTGDLTPEISEALDPETRHWIYNGLDCCLTSEIFNVLEPQLDPFTRRTYHHALSLQGPVMAMKLRGVLVDQRRRAQVLSQFEEQLDVVAFNLARLVCDGVGYRSIPADLRNPKTAKGEFNGGSPHQIKELLYHVMRLPERKRRGKVTADRDALESLFDYFHATPILNHLLVLRDLSKKIGVLRTAIDSDGRMRTSYNIAGTETGRFSSNVSDFGTGTNLQNIEDALRAILVADPGMKFAYIDLEQAESRAVGAICWNLFRLDAYLSACESGDLHTTVTKMARRDLPWTGDPRTDRGIADGIAYRHLTYRDLSKKLGHGSNYDGKPPTMARHSHLPVPVVKEFQHGYFSGFPEIPMWHAHVKRQLLEEGNIISLSGRRRYFFGRRNDPATQREAIAFDPQGSVGDFLNIGMRQVWRLNRCELLLQVHDAILVQYPEHLEDEVIPLLQKEILVDVPLAGGRTLTIPCDTATGWNFSKFDPEKNPDGLKKFKGGDTRKRTGDPSSSELDFILC